MIRDFFFKSCALFKIYIISAKCSVKTPHGNGVSYIGKLEILWVFYNKYLDRIWLKFNRKVDFPTENLFLPEEVLNSVDFFL